MTGRVSSESNHVDMRRDWVVEVSLWLTAIHL
jgi:hypothetical protein